MSQEVTIRRRRRERDFTDLPNLLIRDERISWKALGLLVYLLHLPPDWKLRLSHLAKRKGMHGSKRDATRTAIGELEVAGYLQVVQLREGGKFKGVDWIVSDEPVETGSGSDISPRSDFPAPVFPYSENPTLIRTNNTKQNICIDKLTTTKAPAGAASGGVHFEELPAGLQDKVKQLVEDLSPVLQADVVDELLGQIKESVAKQPERLLRALVKAAMENTLTLDSARRHRERRRAREAAALAKVVAAAPPEDYEEGKKKGASLLQRLAPSVASRINSSTSTQI